MVHLFTSIYQFWVLKADFVVEVFRGYSTEILLLWFHWKKMTELKYSVERSLEFQAQHCFCVQMGDLTRGVIKD